MKCPCKLRFYINVFQLYESDHIFSKESIAMDNKLLMLGSKFVFMLESKNNGVLITV